MRTALDLITASLKRLGVVSGIETPSADLAQDALDRLNDLIESWRGQSLNVWAIQPVPIPIVGGHQPYTLGPGGDYAVRPEGIEGVNVRFTGALPYELPLERDDTDQWRLQRVKSQTGPQPTHFHYEPAWPMGQLWVWPVALGGAATALVSYIWTPLDKLPTLTTVVDLPSGYFRALRDNLALELAPEVGRQVDGALVQSATDAFAQLKRQNFRPQVLGMPAGISTSYGGGSGGGYNWQTDE